MPKHDDHIRQARLAASYTCTAAGSEQWRAVWNSLELADPKLAADDLPSGVSWRPRVEPGIDPR